MIIVDIETSGLDFIKCGVLSIGAIDFDNPDDTFYSECQLRKGADINPDSLKVSGFNEQNITDTNKPSADIMLRNFLNWLSEKDDQTIAGQNVHWDLEFLRHECKRYGINYKFGHRIVDLHSIAFFRFIQKGEKAPLKNNRTDLDLDVILKLCGLKERTGAHNALEDAKLEAECFRRLI